MRKNNWCVSVVTGLILSFAFSFSAAANSSWRWITESRPYDVLPFVIVFTLLIETYAIKHLCRIESTFRVFVPVFLGNILSYAAPYIGYSQTPPYAGYYSFAEILDRCPFYTVGTVYLFITLIVEIPVVYAFLRKKADNKNILFKATFAVNVFTTVLVAITERVICRGKW